MDLTASMTEKRTALAAEIESVLSAIEPGFHVVTRFSKRAERPGASKADRDAVMGSPIRYCRIAHIQSATGERGASAFGQATQASHTFAVLLWREYDDFEASQAAWDAITEGVSPDGVLTHLRGLGGLPTATNEVYVSQPTDVIIPDEPLYLGDEDFAYYLQFFITLT